MTTYTDVTVQQVNEIAKQIKESAADRTLCLSQFTKVQVIAPTAKRKTHKFKFEVEISEDTFIGEHMIHDFGGLVMLDIATNRFKPEYLQDK